MKRFLDLLGLGTAIMKQLPGQTPRRLLPMSTCNRLPCGLHNHKHVNCLEFRKHRNLNLTEHELNIAAIARSKYIIINLLLDNCF